jgi:hypothetical protein
MRAKTLLRGERRLAVVVLVGVSVTLGLLAHVYGLEGFALAGLALLVAASLLVSVQSPVGVVPIGYALVVAFAGLLSTERFLAVAALGILTAAPVLVVSHGRDDAGRRVLRWAVASFAAAGGAALTVLLVPGESPLRTLLHVAAAGALFMAVDFIARNWVPTAGAPIVRLWEIAPVYLSLLCAAGLLAVGDRQGGEWLALVAIFPLVLTRFAYDRYAAAQEAYRQTIKALSIVPEVAGVTPLGHGERSAVYSVAMARELGLGYDAVERVATAARLHHIGYVTVDDPEESMHGGDRPLLGRLGGEILRQTEFLADVGDLVERVHDEDDAVMTREAAVLRVASTFDHLVLEQRERAKGAVELIAYRQNDPYGAAAVLALRRVLERDPGLLERAAESAAPMTEAGGATRSLWGGRPR